MNQMLMLLVLGAALLVVVWLVVSSLAAVPSSAVTQPRLRAIFARVVCPETDTPLRVRLGVVTENERAVPQVLSCERFASGPVTCDRACFERADATELPITSAALV